MKADDMKIGHYYQETILHGGGVYYAKLIDIRISSVDEPDVYVLLSADEEGEVEYKTLEELNHTAGSRWRYVGIELPDYWKTHANG